MALATMLIAQVETAMAIAMATMLIAQAATAMVATATHHAMHTLSRADTRWQGRRRFWWRRCDGGGDDDGDGNGDGTLGGDGTLTPSQRGGKETDCVALGKHAHLHDRWQRRRRSQRHPQLDHAARMKD